MKMRTLTEVIRERRLALHTGITFIEGTGEEEFLSYNDLYAQAIRVLGYLQEWHIQAGDELVLQVEDNRTFVVVFWACILGGIIPVPLTVGKNDDHRQKVFNVWPALGNPYLIASPAVLDKIGQFAHSMGLDDLYREMEGHFIDETQIYSSEKDGDSVEAAEKDIAFIQFSSGSTGSPKGVVLTHKNLITNVRAISNASGYREQESMLSWMPLTHDMGLIGFHINPLFCGMQHFLMPPALFVRLPALWLNKATKHKVNILSSPNFGYEYLLRHCQPASGEQMWDLSSVRILYNGAEPISPQLCTVFLEALSRYGLKRHAMCPVYGLAEASLAVTISGITDDVITVDLDRGRTNIGDKIVLSNDTAKALSVVNVGRVIDDCMIRIADDAGTVLPEERIGHVQITGDNVISRYYNNEVATKNAFTADGWLKTGDLGFMKEASLFIAGRSKDIFFWNGQNFYPHDIERTAEEVAGIKLNQIAVAGIYDQEAQKDIAIAFVDHKGDVESFIPLAARIGDHINRKFGFEPDFILPVKGIPRTTSGKLKRFQLLGMFTRGDFSETAAQVSDMLRRHRKAAAFTAPREGIEGKLMTIWESVLKNAPAGVDQRFFDIGGNSLKAAEMAMLVQREFQVELSLETIYERQTIRELADTIAGSEKKSFIGIPAAPQAPYYPVSMAQRNIYYFWETNRSSVAYNLPVAVKIAGKIDLAKLEDCIRRLIRRHPSLRTSFHLIGEPVFKIAEDPAFVLDCLECSRQDIEEKLRQLIQPFDLARGGLFRIKLLRMEGNEQILFVDLHHIISDGISIRNFLEELGELYSGRELSPLPIEYKDYAVWEKEYLQSEGIRGQREYWVHRLQGELPILQLYPDFQRPPLFCTEGGRIGFEFNEEITARLARLAREKGSTLHSLLFTLYRALLYKYSGQEDILIGIPVSGRRHPDLLRIQGMFVNSLVIRSTIKGDEDFVQLLERQHKDIAAALDNQDYPFDLLRRELAVKRDPGRNPLFDSMFIYQNGGMPSGADPDLLFSRFLFDPGFSKFDLSMEVVEDGGSLQLAFEYASGLFRKETIAALEKRFCRLVKAVLNDPHSKLADIPILSEKEEEEYIRSFNETQTGYPETATIHQLFEEQVRRTPHHIAVEYRTGEITYAELDERASNLAVLLRTRGIGPGSIVGILLERSPDLIISILAALKAGGCYLPIETDLPVERKKYLLASSGCRLLVAAPAADERWYNDLPGIDILDLREPVPQQSAGQPKPEHGGDPHDLAYIIYTSGTTGLPKGVMIEHRSLVNYICWAAKNYVRNENLAFPLYTSISFDLTITSIFTPLVTGNRIVIYPGDEKELLLEKVVADNKVDIIKLTPSHLKLLAGDQWGADVKESRIRKMIVGGERLDTALALDIYRKFGGNVEIYNEYGPTEATVGCMIHQFDPQGSEAIVPIGIPAANTQIYVLDSYLKPVVAGIPGEIYIAGDGLARGYLFNEAATKEKFVANPFIEGSRMYRTGDVGRWLSAGIIEYIGRADLQVKIDGYRVEPAEIEVCLTSYELVKEAVVIFKETDRGDRKNLYAYYISEKEITESALRGHLASRLPYYMIPAGFIRIDHIPLTKNGKIDHNALPGRNKAMAIDEHAGPGNETEKIFLKIWEEVLRTANLSVTANFFELGGDSVKAVQIVSRLAEYGILLRVKDILIYHTIAQISPHATASGEKAGYDQENAEGDMPLTPIQTWFFDQAFENPHYYNQSASFRFNRNINRVLLAEAFRRVVEYHDSLLINYNPEKRLLFYNYNHLREDLMIGEFPDAPEIYERISGEFDISRTLLIKAALIQEEASFGRLFVAVHHLVTDGFSWRILMNDLHAVYEALEKGEAVELPRKTATMKAFANELLDFSTSDVIDHERVYWETIENTNFRIPQDLEPDCWKTESLDRLSGALGKEETAFLVKEAHKIYKTDVAILLNAALVLTLKEWAGLDTCVIQQESHGRHIGMVDVSRTMGWFTVMYPVKFEWKNGSIGDQIMAVKEELRNVPNGGVGYAIWKHIRKPGIGDPAGLAEVRFNYLGEFGKEFENGLFSYCNGQDARNIDPANRATARLEINLMVVEDVLNFDLHYNRQAFRAATMSRMRDIFLKKIKSVLEHIKNEQELHFTPSDFDTSSLNQEELDALFC